MARSLQSLGPSRLVTSESDEQLAAVVPVAPHLSPWCSRRSLTVIVTTPRLLGLTAARTMHSPLH